MLLSEALHYADALLEKAFPGMSHSEIQELDDWTAKIPAPTTPEDVAAAARATSPGVVALALLADPLRVYRSVISKHPELNVTELHQAATDEWVTKFSEWRNIVFHVPDTRVGNQYRLASEFLQTSPDELYKDLISGLWRFFLPGDWLANIAK